MCHTDVYSFYFLLLLCVYDFDFALQAPQPTCLTWWSLRGSSGSMWAQEKIWMQTSCSISHRYPTNPTHNFILLVVFIHFQHAESSWYRLSVLRPHRSCLSTCGDTTIAPKRKWSTWVGCSSELKWIQTGRSLSWSPEYWRNWFLLTR